MTIPVFWVQDSGGVNTCHRNGPSMKLTESYVGKIIWLKNGPEGPAWYSQLLGSDELTKHENYNSARLRVENSVV